MNKYQSDKDWEKWGQIDPYFGVLTDEQFKRSNLNENSMELFFESGEQHIKSIFATINRIFQQDFKPNTSIDFGCGAGRLLIPLARISRLVIGLDVSESMLDESRLNCDRLEVKNIRLEKSDDELSNINAEKVDFIHSYIVFQHIPVARGKQIFTSLLSKLDVGGIGAVHFTFLKHTKGVKKAILNLKNQIRLVHTIRNLVKGEPLDAPAMQMNEYNLNELVKILYDNNCRSMFVEFTDHNCLGGVIYFRKTALV